VAESGRGWSDAFKQILWRWRGGFEEPTWWLHCRSLSFFPSLGDKERAELLAYRRAVTLAKEMSVAKLELEMDYMGVVAKLHGTEVDRRSMGLWSRRLRHSLGHAGCENNRCNTWLG
jgi:hypothetical protein